MKGKNNQVSAEQFQLAAAIQWAESNVPVVIIAMNAEHLEYSWNRMTDGKTAFDISKVKRVKISPAGEGEA